MSYLMVCPKCEKSWRTRKNNWYDSNLSIFRFVECLDEDCGWSGKTNQLKTLEIMQIKDLFEKELNLKKPIEVKIEDKTKEGLGFIVIPKELNYRGYGDSVHSAINDLKIRIGDSYYFLKSIKDKNGFPGAEELFEKIEAFVEEK